MKKLLFCVFAVITLAACDEPRQQVVQAPAPVVQQAQPQVVQAAPAPVIVQAAPAAPAHNGMQDMLLGGVIGHMIGSSGRAAAPSAPAVTHVTKVTNVTNVTRVAPTPAYRPAPSYSRSYSPARSSFGGRR